MKVRLQKFLADAGIASRRKSEALITSGLISVNGEIVKELGTKIEPEKDIVKYKDQVIKVEQKLVYLLLNKPVGYITSATDPRGRKTVIDLMHIKERVFPVGRLDYNSSGLLLITNDGDLTYKLTHPKHHISKKYNVSVKGQPSSDQLNRLRQGVDLGLYKTSKCHIHIIKTFQHETELEVVLYEGKNRQIRRMFDHIHHPVLVLKRIAIGKIQLGALQEGSYRYLTKEEISYLKRL